ncbi:MAG: hypothetical protein LBL74_00805 [Bacteroidales bacterium]|jgi:hypothetical protein|nr:hypothetical protein [Bacteroidales bacterium]
MKTFKKSLLAIAIVAFAVVFSSCDGEKDIDDVIKSVTGSASFTLNGTNHTMPSAVFVKNNGKLMITSTDTKNYLVLYISAASTGEYELGLGKNVTDVAGNIGDISSLLSGDGNYLAYTANITDYENATVALIGSVNFEEMSDSKVKGTFSATAIKASQITNLDVTDIVALLTGSNLEGEFEAVGKAF